MASGDNCSNCKFVGTRSDEQGNVVAVLCRRHPPRCFAQFFLVQPPAVDGQPPGEPHPIDMSNTYWPTVRPTDWCGEHVVGLAVASPASLRRS